MKPKLLIVSWDGINDTGGVERVTQYMCEAWKEKYDIEIIDLEQTKRELVLGKLLVRKHNTIDALLVSCYVNKVRKKLYRKNIDCKCITQGYNAPFVKADLAFIHGTMRKLKMALEGDRVKWKFNQLFEKICCQNSKVIIAVSEAVKDEVNELYGISLMKLHTIENCVDTGQFWVNPNITRTGKYRLIFSGRLEARKGLDTLLDLAKKVEEQSNFELYIATPGKMNTELFVGLKHTVIKQGLNKNEMTEFYQNGDLMYFPSFYEGFGLVTVESLSCGVPVIGRNVGVIKDLCGKGMEGVYLLNENVRGGG